ncbi:hypothetical protein GN958_ATG10194 [Phytophthora infestans]|uniref:Uncharacterized protein n=1 Tax=Phytophthora infestans TaxID=4787 RepID=A0A8S9UNH2_PHYIN|nr:hypothetical protein GN958_ATG10194 [Phytophthora infestans]
MVELARVVVAPLMQTTGTANLHGRETCGAGDNFVLRLQIKHRGNVLPEAITAYAAVIVTNSKPSDRMPTTVCARAS